MAKSPAWTRSEGKNPEGGLNDKGRASLKAAGHDIKRPQPEGGARKDSFCARMKGMKAKLTSSETANDPDSRINKSLRKWNCRALGGNATDVANQYRETDGMRDKHLLKQRLLEKVLRKEKESKTPSASPAVTTPYKPSPSTPNMSKEIYEKGNLGGGNYALAKGGAAQAASKVARRYRAFGGTDVPPATPVPPVKNASAPPSAQTIPQANNTAPNNLMMAPAYRQYADDINNAYKTYLGREGDAEGLRYWGEQFDAGNASLGNLRDTFLSSQEGKNYAKSNPTQLVQALYQQNLGRPSDEAGANYWTQQLRQGMSPQDIYNVFAGTDEAANYGLVNEIYQQNLGRSVDPEGLKYWSDMLNNGTMDTEDLGNLIHGSDEGQNYYRSEFAKNYLGRDLNPEEVSNWKNYVKSGQGTNEAVENAILNSAEAKDYDLRNFVTEEYVGLLGKQPTPEQIADAISQLSSGKITKDQFDKDLSNSEASQLYQASNFEPYDEARSKGVGSPKAQPRTPFQAIKNLAAPIGGAYDELSDAAKTYIQGLIGTESSGNPTAAATKSSAKGLFQFINSTWDSTFKDVFGKNTGLTQKQIRALRTDTSPEGQAINLRMGIELMKQSEQKLKEKGLPITDANLYSVHFSGGTKAAEGLEKNPDAPVSAVLSKPQVRANKAFKKMTVKEMMSTFGDKIKKNVGLGKKAVDNYKSTNFSVDFAPSGTPTTPSPPTPKVDDTGGTGGTGATGTGVGGTSGGVSGGTGVGGIGGGGGGGGGGSGGTGGAGGGSGGSSSDAGGTTGGVSLGPMVVNGTTVVPAQPGYTADASGVYHNYADHSWTSSEYKNPWGAGWIDTWGAKRGGRINKDTGGAVKNAMDVARAYKKGGPVWDKPRPKSLGKPEPLTSGQKSSAKAAAKAAGRPYPNLVDNMRAAKKD